MLLTWLVIVGTTALAVAFNPNGMHHGHHPYDPHHGHDGHHHDHHDPTAHHHDPTAHHQEQGMHPKHHEIHHLHSMSHELPGGSNVEIHRAIVKPVTKTNEDKEVTHDDILAAGMNHPVKEEKNYHPFDTRFQVARVEISDEEWEEEIRDGFRSSGLIPGIIKTLPSALANVNFGTHNCVHLGTAIDAEESAYEPTDIGYGGKKDRMHAVVMVDVDNEHWLHWMVVDVPGNKIKEGKTVTQYQPPMPSKGSGVHRYVIIVLEQSAKLDPQLIESFVTETCGRKGRQGFDLEEFQVKNHLSEPVAANYFRVEHSPFVDSIAQYCSSRSS